MSAFKRIGLIGRAGHVGVAETLSLLRSILETRGLQVMFDDQSAAMLSGHQPLSVPRAELGAQADLVIVVGGDGSMLGVAPVSYTHLRAHET